MKSFLLTLFAIGFLQSNCLAAEVVAGDSIGVGVGMASGTRTVATVSASIFAGSALKQLSLLGPGTRTYLLLGTNDVGLPTPPEQKVAKILRLARTRNIDLVWVGPPCLRSKRLAANVVPFDIALSRMVKRAGFQYVSLSSLENCTLPRSKDGVHFSSEGYKRLWNMIRQPTAPPAPQRKNMLWFERA